MIPHQASEDAFLPQKGREELRKEFELRKESELPEFKGLRGKVTPLAAAALCGNEEVFNLVIEQYDTLATDWKKVRFTRICGEKEDSCFVGCERSWVLLNIGKSAHVSDNMCQPIFCLTVGQGKALFLKRWSTKNNERRTKNQPFDGQARVMAFGAKQRI